MHKKRRPGLKSPTDGRIAINSIYVFIQRKLGRSITATTPILQLLLLLMLLLLLQLLMMLLVLVLLLVHTWRKLKYFVTFQMQWRKIFSEFKVIRILNISNFGIMCIEWQAEELIWRCGCGAGSMEPWPLLVESVKTSYMGLGVRISETHHCTPPG